MLTSHEPPFPRGTLKLQSPEDHMLRACMAPRPLQEDREELEQCCRVGVLGKERPGCEQGWKGCGWV